MSSYYAQAFNPKTKRIERAFFKDDAFGQHRYGVTFEGDSTVYHPNDVGFRIANAYIASLEIHLGTSG